MKKKFNIRRDSEREVFRAYVEMIKPFLRGLRTRECDVFSEILYQYSLKDGVTDPKDKFALILGGSGRDNIAKELDMSQAILRNAISSLRKKGILKDDNTISNVYILGLNDNELELSFIFTVK